MKFIVEASFPLEPLGLPLVWLTSLLHGSPVLEGCSHAEEVPS